MPTITLKSKKKRHLFYKNKENEIYTLAFKINKNKPDAEYVNNVMKPILENTFKKYKKVKQKVGLQLVYYFQPVNIPISTKFFYSISDITYPDYKNKDGSSFMETDNFVDLILINQVFIKDNKGGYDKFNKNDCLFYSLKQSLGDKLKYQPSTLKKKLGLNRNDMISVDDIEILEDILKCNINVSGDYDYVSNKHYPYKCYTKLENKHYTYMPNKTVHKQLYNNTTNKGLCIYENKEGIFTCYDGKEMNTFENFDDFEDFIKTNNLYHTLKKYTDNMKDEYEYIMDEVEILKPYNLHLDKCCYSFVNLAKNTFYNTIRSLEIEDLTKNEELFLFDTKNCGLMYADKGFKGNVKTYDINSYYPHILKSKKFYLPVGIPEEHSINEFGTVIGYGLYKCKIDIPENCKYIMNNKNNVYTHYDVNIARELGYNITLCDGINFLFYKKKMLAYNIFEEYINKMYDIKTKCKSRGSKILLNCLWGSLCEKNYRIFKDSKKNELCLDNLNTTKIYENFVKYIKDKYYKLPFARFGCFITAYGRYKLYETFKSFADKVVRIHTDSFTVINNFDITKYITIGHNIGEYKLENGNKNMIKTGNIEIVHLNKMITVGGLSPLSPDRKRYF